MQHPGNGWTVLCACALLAWSVGGTVYTRRLLRPMAQATVRGQRQLEMARSSRDPLARRLYLAKALHTTRSHHHLPAQARRWNSRVYTPVCLVLLLVNLVMVVWGLTVG